MIMVFKMFSCFICNKPLKMKVVLSEFSSLLVLCLNSDVILQKKKLQNNKKLYKSIIFHAYKLDIFTVLN